MTFPLTRMRRMRRTPRLRAMVREHRLSPSQLILPIFVEHGEDSETPIGGIPGTSRLTIDRSVALAEQAAEAGLGGVLLFGIPAEKDEAASEAWDNEGIVQLATRAMKSRLPDLTVITDVCLCQYTDHGHCGLIRDGEVHNDLTNEILATVARSHAKAGADVVAPSDMMDGRIGTMRTSLDDEGYSNTAIMSYAAKYASSFYGPFREAAESTPAEGDRRGYQMDPANRREALREIALDVEEGADVVMVKPAGAYLDVISDARRRFETPIAAYQVSGEYAMIKAAADKGWVEGDAVLMESLLGIHRAGADMVITYGALDAARMLTEGTE